MSETFIDKTINLLTKIQTEESELIQTAADLVAKSIGEGGIIHLFGCGHSHILTEDVFYRAGGLAAISPIFHEPLMLHEGAARSSQLERKNDYAENFMTNVDFQKNDLLFVLSTSGRNPVPVDVALYAKEKGVKVIVITSLSYSGSQSSRHVSKKHLYDVGDLVIDNYSPIGDAVMTIPELNTPFSSTSTIVGATILQSIFAQAIIKLAGGGNEVPVFLSGNIEHSDTHNQALVDKYSNRIPLLTMNLAD